jgi:GAF domain-containing protein
MTKKEKYENLLKQADALLLPNEPVITALANLSALVFNELDYVSWCGFYLAKDERLYLGPFQGNVACEFIDFGKGVCGTAARKNETVIVPNVHDFEGHIACDDKTNSEIVVPISCEGKIFGVFDLDSYDYAAFDETDKNYLEKVIEILKKNVRLVDYQLL